MQASNVVLLLTYSRACILVGCLLVIVVMYDLKLNAIGMSRRPTIPLHLKSITRVYPGTVTRIVSSYLLSLRVLEVGEIFYIL